VFNFFFSKCQEIIQLSASVKPKDNADIQGILESYNELYDTYHSLAFEELDKIIKNDKEIVMILKKMLFVSSSDFEI
jgi:hypothetical protein